MNGLAGRRKTRRFDDKVHVETAEDGNHW